jgi:lysophospholipase L1-like esterase
MIIQDALILFQGDSITDTGRNRDVSEPNVAAGLGLGYAHMVAARILAARPNDHLKFLNRGIGGNRVPDLAARWAPDCLDLEPDVVSILVGINDTWHGMDRARGVPLDEYERIYRELLVRTREVKPDVKYVLCEPFALHCGAVTEEWFPELNERREIVRHLASEFSGVFVPFQSVFDEAVEKAPPDYWAADGVHPTPAGHHLMAESWLRETGMG